MTVSKDCKFQKTFSIYYLPEFHVTTRAARTNMLKLTSIVSYSKGETLPFAEESIQNWAYYVLEIINLYFHPFMLQKVTLDLHLLQCTFHCRG